jgi:NAD(P)-dependent dehydrogenase (short-subunit alcohol dehydrogenase family)
LAQLGATVILACRDVERSKAAAEEIKLGLASHQSTHSFSIIIDLFFFSNSIQE